MALISTETEQSIKVHKMLAVFILKGTSESSEKGK